MWDAALSFGARFVPKRLTTEIDVQSRRKAAPQPIATGAACAEAIFAAGEQKSHVEIDRLFAVLMLLQWVTAIIIAFVVSPRTWIGDEARVHVHVWAAV